MKSAKAMLACSIVLLVLNLMVMLLPRAAAQDRPKDEPDPTKAGHHGKCVGASTFFLRDGGTAVFMRVWEDGSVEKSEYVSTGRYGPFRSIH